MPEARLTVAIGDAIYEIAFEPPARLSAVLSRAGFAPDMPCGGRGRCLKCAVRAEGALSPRAARENETLPPDMRYACMTDALGDARVTIAAKSGDEILTDGVTPDFAVAPWGEGLGAAVDIGTTTVAAYLYELGTGRLVATASARNPQAPFGADVISRMEQSLAGKAEALAEAIRGCVAKLIGDMARGENVSQAVLTGNSAMLYLLTGENPASLTAAPFEMDDAFGRFVAGETLGLPGARVYLPRCVSAYVGADITCAMLSSGLLADGRPAAGQTRLMVDIGTNGEMALLHGGKLLCCSTAAGPAFEGAGIHMGAPARRGAISAVKYENGKMSCAVIGDCEADGICGSGLVDAVACMLRAGVLDETGVINEEDHDFTDCVTEIDGLLAFKLPGSEVALTQKDIRAVQLAKSAICSGMLTLISTAGIAADDVRELLIAGGFGSKINVTSAEAIGLIPPGFAAKARSIGNAAGAGAAMVLLSGDILAGSEKARECAHTVELSGLPLFMEHYVENMLFPI